MISRNDLLLYAITDRCALSERAFLRKIEEALQGGITLLQLREKKLCSEQLFGLGQKVKALTDAYEVPLIINDNVQVAQQLSAAGVHLGQEDMSVTEARKILGADKIIGKTAKTREQAVEAEKAGADYLGAGRLFSSATKSTALPISKELFRSICLTVKIPVCAVGGIEKNNIYLLKNTGLAGIALSRGIFGAENTASECRELLNALADIGLK